MAKEKTVLEILKELKDSDKNDISWAMKYYEEGQPKGLSVEEWLQSFELSEEEYRKLMEQPGIGDPMPGVVDLGA